MNPGKTHFADDDTLKYIEELEGALDELCRLKQYKEMFGKTPEYLHDQPRAWEKAFALVLAKAE